MYKYLPITDVYAREILDSRGNPTIEVEVLADGHICGRASVPSGASTGCFEAKELRDGGKRYRGLGMRDAVDHVNARIAPELIGINVMDQTCIDAMMLRMDGTKDKSNLGANAILGVSLAVAVTAAKAAGLPLYVYLGGSQANTLPVPMMNIINGGVHAPSSGLDVQEYMIVPVGAPTFGEALRWCVEVFHALASILQQRGHVTSVGDEGGFAPELKSDKEAIEMILEAIRKAGYTTGKGIGKPEQISGVDLPEQRKPYGDFMLAIDAAASEWKSEKGTGYYQQPKSGNEYTTDTLIHHWEKLAMEYPIISIEDGLDEEDWNGWKILTKRLGDHIQLVGDDLFTTNAERLLQGIEKGAGNSILIKFNQIGSVSETLEVIKTAHRAGFTAISSHRSGETADTTIADLAVALNTCQIKAGAPSRLERVNKYNQLLRIEEALGTHAVYPGIQAFHVR